MTEIEQIKIALDKVDVEGWLADEDCPICKGDGFTIFDTEAGFERDECSCLIPESKLFNSLAPERIHFLLTTIESQKQTIINQTIERDQLAVALLQANIKLRESDVARSIWTIKLQEAEQIIESQKEEIEGLRDALEMLPPKDIEIHERTQFQIDKSVDRILIDSLQAAVETLKSDKSNYHRLYLKHMEESVKQKLEIESLKAITELAVKGLKWYAGERYGTVQFMPPIPDVMILSDCGKYAKDTLSEISKLS